MQLEPIKKLEKTYLAQTYRRSDVLASSGDGAIVEGDKQYIDFSSGIGVNSFGFAYPAWVKAVCEQAAKLGHMSNLYYTEPMVQLAKNLCERIGMQRVFFANSGAEANEGAIKTARKYGHDHHGANCHQIITLQNSFHGRTITTLSATGQDVFHKDFGPFTDGFVHAEANDFDDLLKKVNDNTCAIMLECIQGEGGVLPLEDEYLQQVSALCKERDILLIVDEVQTGVGRTGKFLCAEYFGLQPDLVTLAKGLGGGLPIGAVLFGEKTADVLCPGDHATTFGGNPVACAGALAVLEAMDDAFLDTVAEKGSYFTQKLLAMPGVTAVSGKGLMLGVELEEGLVSAEIAAACAQKGLIVLTAKHKVRLLPPLSITQKEIDSGLAILHSVLDEMTK